MTESRKYAVVSAAFGLASHRRETQHGPRALMEQGLIDRLRDTGAQVIDAGEVGEPNKPGSIKDPKMKYLPEVKAFGRSMIEKLRPLYAENYLPLIIGGDHSVSIASISCASEHVKSRFGSDKEVGLLWVDAHADINTAATTPSGNIHGMAVAALLGHGHKDLTSIGGKDPKIKPENLVYIGLRDVDPGERELIKELNITAYTMRDIDSLGMHEVCRRAISQLSQSCAGFVLSFDLDVCEPELAPGVGTPVRGGLTLRESHLLMELAHESDKLLSLELLELNPLFDKHEMTEQIAIWLLQSAVGRTIL